MFQRLLILILFFLTHNGFAQYDNPSDSLQKKSFKYLESKIKNNSISQPLKSVYIDAYITKAKKEQDTVEIGHGFHYKTNEGLDYVDGSYYLNNGDELIYKKGLLYSDSIIYYTKDLDHRIYPGLGYGHKGFFLYNLGFHKDALDNYLIAYTYALKHNNESQLPSINHAINTIRHNGKSNSVQTKKGLDSLKTLLNTKEKYLYDFLYELDNLVNDLQWEKKFDLAFDYINEGIDKSINLEGPGIYNGFVFSAGINYYFTKDYDKALDSINKSESKLSITSLSLAYHLKGKIYQETDTIKAIAYFNKVDSIFQINQTPIYGLLDNYKSLINLHKQNNSYSKQIESIDKLIYADSIIHATKIYVEDKILKEYEIPNYKKEKEQIILKLRENNNKRKKYILYLSSLVLLVSVSSLYYYRKHLVFKKRFNELIKESNTLAIVTPPNKGTAKELNIPENTILDILSALDSFESKHGFLDNGISLNNLSRKMNTNSSYLSKVVNYHKNKSFSNYISDLRIDYVVQELKFNNSMRKHTISAIAEEIGFNNPESFSKAFYKKTGIYPSYFIKQLNKNDA